MSGGIAKREPALVVAVCLAVVVGAGGFLTAWGGGVDWRLALGGAFTASATTLGGGALVRSQVTPVEPG